MRFPKNLIAATAVLLTGSVTALADEPTHVPATAQAQVQAATIAKADHALRGLVTGLHNVWIFPTDNANSVFVTYTTDTDHVALLEMQGERVASLRDLNSNTDGVRAAAR